MEELRPVGKRLIRSDDGAGLLIAIGDESEKQIALFSVYRCVADLINDNQGWFIMTSPSAPAVGLLVSFQFPDEIFHSSKINAQAGLTGLQRKRYGQMRFPHPRGNSDILLIYRSLRFITDSILCMGVKFRFWEQLTTMENYTISSPCQMGHIHICPLGWLSPRQASTQLGKLRLSLSMLSKD